MKKWYSRFKAFWSGLKSLELPKEENTKPDLMQYHHEKKPDKVIGEMMNELTKPFTWKG